MNFISLAELYRDMVAWERQLPQFDAICGVPRSGLIPATYIALRRNIRLVEISDLLRQPEGAIARAHLRPNNPVCRYNIPYGNKLLIVDDSSSVDSVTFTGLRQQLAAQTDLQITYGAVYRSSKKSLVDCYYREVAQPRMFEWNWWRNWWTQFALCDLDGVLCEDWKGKSEVTDDLEFAKHVREVTPLYIPQMPIKAVVTSRIEKYRKETEKWLAKHNVTYSKLIMHPASTPELRRQMNDHAIQKAEAYMQIPESNLFIESDVKQAAQIFKLTQRPVLCIDSMTMFK
jgi:uncharacterized HAD superfamily protein